MTTQEGESNYLNFKIRKLRLEDVNEVIYYHTASR